MMSVALTPPPPSTNFAVEAALFPFQMKSVHRLPATVVAVGGSHSILCRRRRARCDWIVLAGAVDMVKRVSR